jgi:hypothetical protein
MSRRVLTLVEGQTEERFVKDVLAPGLLDQGLMFAKPTVLMTKRVLSGGKFRGGITGFGKFENDLKRLLHGAGGAIVTTLIDYYRLPSDFPGMASRPAGAGFQRAAHVEAAILQHFGSPSNLVPHLSLHEFEALLFVDPRELAASIPAPEKLAALEAIRAEFKSPEEINERPGHSPAERIAAHCPTYGKVLHGPPTAARIGLAKIRACCPQFDAWLRTLQDRAQTPGAAA